MNLNTDELIDSLSDMAEPVKPAAGPVALMAKWLAISLITAGTYVLGMGMRSNMEVLLQLPMYVAELQLLTCIILTTGLSASVLSYPDLCQKRWLVALPVVPVLMFIILLWYGWRMEAPLPTQPGQHGIECLLCIAMLTIVPAAWFMHLLRKQATTHYYLAGGTTLLAAFSVGALALRLVEETESIRHLVLWHYLPVIAFYAVGLVLGRRLLKW